MLIFLNNLGQFFIIKLVGDFILFSTSIHTRIAIFKKNKIISDG